LALSGHEAVTIRQVIRQIFSNSVFSPTPVTIALPGRLDLAVQ
jgi:hypothetical protein